MKVILRQPVREGDTRIKRNKFLLFPKVIDNELRWFEKASWEESYVCCGFGTDFHWSWEGVRWINDKNQKFANCR